MERDAVLQPLWRWPEHNFVAFAVLLAVGFFLSLLRDIAVWAGVLEAPERRRQQEEQEWAEMMRNRRNL